MECQNKLCQQEFETKANKLYCSKKCANQAFKLKKRYSLTTADFKDIFHEQDGKCKICPKYFNSYNEAFVDHSHTKHIECSGRECCRECVRGLLCNDCNLAIAYFSESVNTLISATKYLNEHNGNKFIINL